MKIDGSVHFWKYSKTVNHPGISSNKLLQQHYLPEQITASLQRNGIDGCIAVISETAELETRFLCELAESHPTIKGLVGWIDLSGEKAVAKIQEFKQYAPIRGYQVFATDKELPAAAVMEVLQEDRYSLDISMGAESVIPAIDKWISVYPEQLFVLQDAGNADTRQQPGQSWENTVRGLAKNKNLFCKLAGLLERGNLKSWKPADIYPFLDILFDAFGPDRLLFASDWPFILTAGIYVQWKSLLEKYTEKLTEDDRDKIFGQNAQLIYRL
jgi:L-fuconolactonase